MASYHVQYVDSYGPYLRKAEYMNEEQGHEWTHIGPVHSVDPASLPDPVVADIRSEGYGLARYRDNSEAAFAHLDVANSTRDEIVSRWGEDVIAPGDDRRETVVQLSEDAPRAAVRVATSNAQSDMADSNSGSGQVELTKREREAIDFTETDIPTAMTHKAAIQDEGVKEWMDVWSEDITTVGEARGAANRNKESMQGQRLDNDDEDVAGASGNTNLDEGMSMLERNAVEGVEEGFDEPRDVLRDEFGWTAAEINEVAS